MLVSGKEVVQWVYEPLGGSPTAASAGIGWVNRNGVLTAGFTLEGWNGVNAFVHHRHEGYAPKDIWFAACDWVFNELGCQRVTASVPSSMLKAKRVIEHIGFKYEGSLKMAGFDGSDLEFYVLWRDECRMLNWQRREAQGVIND